MQVTSGRLERLQALRFWLAAMVVFQHGFNLAHAQFGWQDIGWPFDRFQIGVLGFFVLSGYVVTMALFRSSPKDFFVHRLLRIYPALWLTIVLVIILKVILWGSFPFSAYDWRVLLLIPIGDFSSPLSVEWSLIYEAFYYVVLFLTALLGLKRWITPILLIWILLCLIVNFRDPGITTMFPTIGNISLSIFNASFALGALAWLYKSRLCEIQKRHPGLGWLIAIAGVAGYCLPAANWFAFFSLSVSIAWLIHVLATDERPMSTVGIAVARLGDGSYGLYLIHTLILAICFSKLPAHLLVRDPVAIVIGSILVALTLGTLWGWLEYRMYKIGISHLKVQR